MASLLYSNNADIKYPLSDFHEEDIPNDILLDLSMSIPEGLVPIVGAIRVGLSSVFVSIEDKNTRIPLGSVIVEDPVLARVYPLDMDVTGFGWVVFGPRAITGELFYSGDVAIDVDPEVYTALAEPAHVGIFSVNGFTKELSNVLGFNSVSPILGFAVRGNKVYVDRIDTDLSAEERVGFTGQGVAVEFDDDILFTIDGVEPDENGNIDIDVTGCVEGCLETREITIPRGDTGAGTSGELPLDVFSTRTYLPGDPCAPSTSPEEGVEEDDRFEDCTTIDKVTILDYGSADKAIGTLYTVASVEIPDIVSESSAASSAVSEEFFSSAASSAIPE